MRPLLGILLALVLSVGCSPQESNRHDRILRGAYPGIHLDLDLRLGQRVNLNIGVSGHIIDIQGQRCLVRVNTTNGSEDIWLRRTAITVVVE